MPPCDGDRRASESLDAVRVPGCRDLFPSVPTNATGAYNIMNVSAGTYEVSVTATGYQPQAQTVTVLAGASTTQNFTLLP